jgi:hypothetical protein
MCRRNRLTTRRPRQVVPSPAVAPSAIVPLLQQEAQAPSVGFSNLYETQEVRSSGLVLHTKTGQQ